VKLARARTTTRTNSPATPSTVRFGVRDGRVRASAGFTLIEVLVTALIVVLIASASAKALISTSHASGDQRLRAQANAVASQDLERLRGLSDDNLNGLNQGPRTVNVNGTTFNVTSTANYLDTTGTSTCTSNAAAYYKISSTVTWTENYSNRTDTTVTQESVLARPVTGDLYVQATDQTGAPLSGVAVAATGPDTQNDTTNSAGCVLFAGLSPGGYALTLTDPGYVDPDGNASPPNVTATVTASTPVAPSGNPFRLGRAGSLAGTFTTAATYLGYNGEADGISWLGSGASYGMSGGYRTVTSSAAAASLTTASLFPFNQSTTSTASYTNDYSAWGGRCLQQEPPAGMDTFTVMPGSTGQAANVIEPGLFIGAINYKIGSTTTAVRPAHVKLTFASTAGTPCSDAWYPTLAAGTTVPPAGWLANPGQPFASTATTGTTASASSGSSSPETGQLTICADYNGYKSSVTTTNTNFTITPVATPTITITNGTNAGPC
jgi:prepilin-type N-terminal cleavage/methylation domain-containing protein